ncbi:hypothetical protein KR038_011873, partial [Drosophila bunnanda]
TPSAVLIFLATSVTGLQDKFYRYLDRSYRHENLIGSIYSAEMALGMLFVGAGGETAEELWSALDLKNREDVLGKFEDLLNLHPYTLEVYNYLLVNNEYKVKVTFKEQAARYFEGTTDSVDMKDSKKVTLKINKWMNDRTHGRVQTLATNVGPDVKAILMNAIYFKGQWAKKFNPSLTEQENFHVSATKSVPVQMMAMQGRFRAERMPSLGAKVIELPFVKDGLVMLIYLPDKNDGLDELEEKIDESARPQERHVVNLRLPKFKISTQNKLKPLFNKFGIKKTFKPSANLSGIVDNLNFYVDDVIQEAFIEINEDGVEAATVSGNIKYIIVRSPTMEFTANLPFAYVIRDTHEVYFQGHVIEPEW